MKNLLVSKRRVFIAIPAWNTTAPYIIGELEEVVKEILTNKLEFKNGINCIKELEGLKFIRVPKTDLERMLSHNEENRHLWVELSKIY